MAGLYSVIVPEATTNLVTNPSFESAVTSWTAGGGSLARSLTYAVYGQYSGAYTPSAGTTDGLYCAITLVAATAYAIQAKVHGALGVSYKLYLYDPAGGGTVIGTTTFTGTGDWQQVELLATTNGSTAFRIYISKNDSMSTAAYYVDGVQCEAKAYITTYIDGDQPGGSWTGVRHASTSSRSSQSRAGGKIVEFEDYDGVHVERSTGIGLPNVANNVLDLAILPGAAWASTKIKERQIVLVISANGSSRANLHSLRQSLIDLFKPDAVTPYGQAVILRYTGSGRTLRCSVRYDGGLDMSSVDGFHESIMLRLLAVDPFWYDEYPQSISLTATSSSMAFTGIAAKADGSWLNFGAPATGGNPVNALAYDKDRNVLYVGGLFTNLAGIATCDFIAKYDFNAGAWADLQAGLNGGVNCLVLDTNGILYLAGDFTDAGGDGNADYVAKYNPDTDAFSAIAAGGPSDTATAIAISPLTGYIWCGGYFHTPGSHICYYDGSAWQSITDPGHYLEDLKIDPATGYVWIAGTFGGYVQYWNGSAWSGALGGGLTGGNRAYSLCVGPGSIVYAAGDFDAPSANLAAWNGSAWVSVGVISDTVYGVELIDGKLYIAGGFVTAGGVTVHGFAVGTPSGDTFNWIPMDFLPPLTAVFYTTCGIAGRIFIGGNINATYDTSAQTAIAATGGTAATYPRFTIKRTGGTSATLKYIENVTSGHKLVLNISMLNGEAITVDLTPGNKSFTSSIRGNVLGQVNPAAEIATWCLLPGSNTLNVLVEAAGSPTISATVAWTRTYWSADSL